MNPTPPRIVQFLSKLMIMSRAPRMILRTRANLLECNISLPSSTGDVLCYLFTSPVLDRSHQMN